MEKFYNIKLLALTAVMAAAMTACSDSEPAAAGENTEANVVVTIKAAPSAPQSRANVDWKDPNQEENGVGIENDINSLQIAIYDSDNTSSFVGIVSNLIMLSDNNGTRQYVGKLPVKDDGTDIIVKDKDYRVMVFANCEVTPETDITTMSFDRPIPPTTQISMWGVINSVKFTLDKTAAQQIGTIDLMRSMAKVEIKLSDDENNFITKLISAEISGANTKGYILPAKWNEISTTSALEYDAPYRPLDSTSSTAITSETHTDNRIIFYLPETANNNGSVKISLTYEYKDSQNNTQTANASIDFANYTNGSVGTAPDYFNIVRNNLYRFTVKRTDMNISIQYTVCPINEYTVTPPTFD